VENLIEAAGEAASALAALGYATDFSPASLAEIDRFFDDQLGLADGGALAGDVGGKVFLIGAYVGEVLRRALGGSWAAGDDEPVLELDGGAFTAPFQRVAMRLVSTVDTVAGYGLAYGLVGTAEAAAVS
jgi:hypothetical protein